MCSELRAHRSASQALDTLKLCPAAPLLGFVVDLRYFTPCLRRFRADLCRSFCLQQCALGIVLAFI